MTDSTRLQYLLGHRHADWVYPESHLSYITPEIIADRVIGITTEAFDLQDKVLWDMFAGIGTDSIRFSRVSGKVIASELDPETFRYLQENAGAISNIQTVNKNCGELLDMACDVVYFDPPWGDTFHSGLQFDFTDVKVTQSKKGETIDVVQLALLMQRRCHLIIKSPFLSDSFERVFNKADIVSIHAFPNQKLKFLLIRRHT